MAVIHAAGPMNTYLWTEHRTSIICDVFAFRPAMFMFMPMPRIWAGMMRQDALAIPGFAGGDFVNGSGPRGCAHLVTGTGEMHDDMRDTYAQAFILLSGGWRYKAFNDHAALKTAEDTLGFLNTHLKANNGGWYEALPLPESSQRRQNPHMHLFESFLALYEITKDKTYLKLADDMFELFEKH